MRIQALLGGSLLTDIKKVSAVDESLVEDSDGIKYERKPLLTAEGRLYNNGRDVLLLETRTDAINYIRPAPNAFSDLGELRCEIKEHTYKEGLIPGETDFHTVGRNSIHQIELYHLGE